MEGTSFGRYQLIELLGRGGMGEVWRGHDTTIDRVVAIKMLLPHYAQDPDFHKRFRREARAAARLDDPHVVPIYDVGELDGRLYVTMRLISGRDLQGVIDDGPLPPTRAVHIVEQIASALHSAHRTGLIHRDIKPSNILLAQGDAGHDWAYLIDFGIARAAGDTILTAANTTLGTWSYMAPERFRTGDAEPTSDIYALTCVLYQSLTGQLPFPGDTLEEVAISHEYIPPPRPSHERDGIPAALDDVIAIGLAKRPADRYQDALALAAAARTAITGSTSPPEPAVAAPSGPAHPRPSWPGAGHTQPWQSRSDATTAPAGRIEPPPTVHAAPAGPPPQPAQSPRPERNRRSGLLIAAAAVVLLVAAAVGTVVATWPDRDGAAAPTPAPDGPAPGGPVPNTGPFTGVYLAEFGPPTTLDGAPTDGMAVRASVGVRSTCTSTGCVAAAAPLGGVTGLDLAPQLVFDEVGAQWLSVAVAEGQCDGSAVETWQVLRLRPRPDGNLTGEHTVTTTGQCAQRRAVTLTRTGDVQSGTGIQDPAGLTPRVVSPAEALRGRYRITRTAASTEPGPEFGPLQADSTVSTDCLRDGLRCMSYFDSAAGDLPLVFDGDAWALTIRTEARCSDGAASPQSRDARFPLPQPPRNPIPVLTGRGTLERTGACPVALSFDQTFTRIGD